MSSSEYGNSVAASLLQISHDIVLAERGTGSVEGYHKNVTWKADPEIYPRSGMEIQAKIPGLLNDKLTIIEADFLLDGGDMAITVQRNSRYSLDNDPLAMEFLEIFQGAFEAHPHNLCIAALLRVTEEKNRPTGTPLSWLK